MKSDRQEGTNDQLKNSKPSALCKDISHDLFRYDCGPSFRGRASIDTCLNPASRTLSNTSTKTR